MHTMPLNKRGINNITDPSTLPECHCKTGATSIIMRTDNTMVNENMYIG